ncbi:MAG TPA: DinB family protein [Armatimonadota bacterium]
MAIDSLSRVFEGWEGYNTSLVHAIEPLTAEQLAFRPAPAMSSVGEVAAHIAFGRVGWFHNMGAPGASALAEQISAIEKPGGRATGPMSEDPSELVNWLNATWAMVEGTLGAWTVEDLAVTYPHTYWGKTYAVSRQWTIFRILAHDIHHGGQLTVMLGMQGIEPPELSSLGGHLTEPPLWDGQ